jgi:hypothetical protein
MTIRSRTERGAKGKPARRRKPYRPQLNRDHRGVYFSVARVLDRPHVDPANGYFAPDLTPEATAEAADSITRLCAFAGVPRSHSKAFDDALKAVYVRERAGEQGFDPAPAYQFASRVGGLLNPVDAEVARHHMEWLVANVPGWAQYARAEGAEPAPAESHPEQTKRELFESWRGNALAFAVKSASAFPLAPAAVTDENFARYNIRKGDTLKVTLDGDAEPGELAYVTWYDLDDKARYWTYGFLFIEGDHFCIRGESHLECDDEHHAAECMTIIGRVVAVERGGLTVRLKGLELRGLPFAEDLPPVVEA